MSERKKRSRVLKSESTLAGYLTLGEEFHIGLALTPDIVKGLDLKKYGLDTAGDGDVKVPKAVGPTTKANINGKMGRKQPEHKHEIEKHIDYIRKKDGRRIEYDRIYEVWEKELKHKFNMAFTFKKDSNGDDAVFSPLLKFDNTPANNMKNTHVMNVFLEVLGFSDLYRPNLSPLIKYEKSFDEEILPPGNLGERETFDALMEIAERHANPEDIKPLLHRLEVFKEFNPTIRQSAKGLSGYYAFIFKDKGIVAAESIKRDNATYFFKEEDYENTVIKDKQDILTNRLMLKRLSHTDNWEQSVRKFLNKH